MKKHERNIEELHREGREWLKEEMEREKKIRKRKKGKGKQRGIAKGTKKRING